MRRAGWIALAVVGLAAVGAWADCGCTTPSQPACYETFRSNEIIEFSVVVPIDYFVLSNTSVTPLIAGWRVENTDGVVVRSVFFVSPKGHGKTFTWDGTDDFGVPVPAGFYRIIVTTTSTPEIAIDLEIAPCRWSSCYWNPCGGCRAPVACGCSSPCRPACGMPYLVLASGGTRACCSLTVQIQATFACPAP